jgi:hypothetical protein
MRTVGTAPGTSTFYLPSPTVADMRGLGLINPGDSWLIDRKWGNPGTATIMKQPDGQWGLRGFGALPPAIPGPGNIDWAKGALPSSPMTVMMGLDLQGQIVYAYGSGKQTRTLLYAALGLGVLGVILGGVALARRRR